MRTTIELPDEQRARLVAIAARRGEKGFSGIVQEAVALYLDREEDRAERVRAALAVRGAIRGRRGERLAESTAKARASWR
jgi:predicted transcriptional regulator